MDYQEVKVPRQLIKYHFQHPELYGESIVELINGMVTDVYTHSEGYLYTPTNDQALIDYLKAHKLEDLAITKDFDSFSIRNLTIEDQALIKQWVFENETVEDDSVSLYLSHGFTSRAHMFLLEATKKPIGIFAFNIFNEDLVFSLFGNDDIEVHDLLDNIIPFLKTKYTFKKIATTIKADNEVYQKQLIEIGFTLNQEQTNNLNSNHAMDFKQKVYERFE